MFLVAVGCGSKKPAPQSPPANTSGGTSGPGTSSGSAAETKPAGDDCYKQCLANGPDSSPMTKSDWPTKSADDKANDCSAACADANMPADADK